MLHGSVIEDDVELYYLFVSRGAVKLVIFQENVIKVKINMTGKFCNNNNNNNNTTLSVLEKLQVGYGHNRLWLNWEKFDHHLSFYYLADKLYDHYLNFLLLFFGNINQPSSCSSKLVINEAETFYNEEVALVDI